MIRRLDLNALTDVELQAMRIRGELRRLGHDAWGRLVHIAEIETPEVRAICFQTVCRGSDTVAGAAAHWVWRGGPPPDSIDLLTRGGSRSTRAMRDHPPVRFSRNRIPECDRIPIAGIHVASPAWLEHYAVRRQGIEAAVRSPTH